MARLNLSALLKTVSQGPHVGSSHIAPIPSSFTARERRRDAERRRCLYGSGLTKLWEELGFKWSEVDDVRGDMSLLLGGVAVKSPRTPQPQKPSR